ncbi:MAG: deoxyguanosinetriphosphate triphosphohydrolase [Firmicutes bacterium]|nr:deoxyguanosinetriphosphate triphosphohydrolase [Bacillota bacterium]
MSEWDKLLSQKRFRAASKRSSFDKRNEFENDYSRVVFSSSFRRLQDKAQVFPLENSDFIRTRLTHSQEVSTLGRSIGITVENKLVEDGIAPELSKNHRGEISSILATAGLIHDMGNPPFGHFGETAIQKFFQNWFTKDSIGKEFKLRNPNHAADFENFDGNVQTFRLLRKLQYLKDMNSLNLAFATLASVIKYPRCSIEGNKKDKGLSYKKFGYFQSEAKDFQELKEELQIGNSRHPLAFLLEAADDIAYSIADIEDGCKKGVLTYEIISKTLRNKLKMEIPDEKALFEQFIQHYKETVDENFPNRIELVVQNFRIDAQGHMITAVIEAFVSNLDDIKSGKFDEDLILASKAKNLREAFKELAGILFANKEVIERELVGEKVICGLLSSFVEAVTSPDRYDPKSKNGKVFNLISDNYRYIMKNNPYSLQINDPELIQIEKIDKLSGKKLEMAQNAPSLYDHLLLVTDFVCGMTDSYALELYQKLSGIKL